MRARRSARIVRPNPRLQPHADRIFVFDAGEIVEQGSFDELVAKNGRFAALARAQFMAAEEAPKKAADASESRFV